MPQIVTPLVQLLNQGNVQQQPSQVGQNFLQGLQVQEQQLAGAQQRELLAQKAEQERQVQQISNVGQASVTGLDIIKRDPKNAEAGLRDFIAQRRAILPAIGITNLEDTDALEKALNEGGVPAAQKLLTSTLDGVRSVGFELPPPTTPDFTGAFKGVNPATGKLETFLRSKQGTVIPTGIEAPAATPLVSIGDTTQKQKFDVIKVLSEDKRNLDTLVRQSNQIIDLVGTGGLGAIGASGTIAKGFSNFAAGTAGFLKNIGVTKASDFDTGTILNDVLGDTPLGVQARKSSKVTSLVTNMAFSVAKAAGNSRPTDKDFEAALEIIGAGTDDPQQLIGTLQQFTQGAIGDFDARLADEQQLFDLSQKRIDILGDIKGRKAFETGLQGQAPAQAPGISATTKPSDLTPEQAQQLARDNPELLRQIIANARRGK